SSRFLTAAAMAIAPNCDAVALTGNSGYRYTWIARRNGRRAAVRTANTPLGVAFDHLGEPIAIGTGGNEVLLSNTAGTVAWKTRLPHCCVARDLAFSLDDQAIVVKAWGVAVVKT